PIGLMTDSEDNVYVADMNNSVLRKITPAGEVTTLSGSITRSGSDDGTGAAARFFTPFGVTADVDGNVYVADRDNGTIRKITPTGEVSTLAGTAGTPGSADGTGSAAQFATPFGVATDSAGNVYVADTDNSTIRKITPAGVVSTFAGTAEAPGSADGTGADAAFTTPQGVATDSAGNVYVADSGNHTIRKITPGGVVTTLAGSAGHTGSTNGTGAAARFTSPRGITADGAGNVYVADMVYYTIRKITPAGVVTTLAGTTGTPGTADGKGVAARFSFPAGVAADGAGNLYVSDGAAVRKVTPAGVVTTVVGVAEVNGFVPGSLPGALMPVNSLAVHGTSLYITMANGIVVVSPLP
ncbi:MAG TPA: NHL repeat-containing protein, partial [bacterium]